MERLVLQDASVRQLWMRSSKRSSWMWKPIRWRELLMVNMNEQQQKRARQLAFMLNDAHEGQSTPDDHEAQRSHQRVRDLAEIPGRVGTSSSRSLQRRADDNPVSLFRRRPWTGAGGVGGFRETIRIAERRRTPRHDQGSCAGAQPARLRVVKTRRASGI